jgi:hypothetical protein
MEEHNTHDELIDEGEGKLPWWIWAVMLIWIMYGIFVGPFELTNPGG